MRKTQYIGHLTRGARDFSKPHFALGSKDMRKALINASFENQGGVIMKSQKLQQKKIKLSKIYNKCWTFRINSTRSVIRVQEKE
ncbi:hypothetical protein ACP3V3_01520 [Vibrio sp. PNB22_3_1]|uniref:hypothetical protein n=1 Tax=Vibrio TaxID=662 RepID=UPI0040696422